MNDRRPISLFFSDLHAHPTSNTAYSTPSKKSGSEFLDSLEKTFTFVLHQIHLLKPYWAVCLGDVFHVPGVVDARSLQIVWEAFERLVEACEVTGTELVVIPGNHDFLQLDRGVVGSIHSIPFLSSCLQDQPAIVCHRSLEEGDPRRLAAFIPYSHDSEAVTRCLRSLLEAPVPLAFVGTHVDAKGMLWNAHRKSEVGVDVEVFRLSPTPIFNGHHHTPENHYPWVHVGSSLYRNFTDHIAPLPRGVCVYWEPGRVEWLANPFTEMFHTIRASTEEEAIASLQAIAGQDRQRINLKIVTPASVELPSLDGFKRVKVERSATQSVARTETLSSDVQSLSAIPAELLRAYLDAQKDLRPAARTLVEQIFEESSKKVRINSSSLAYQTSVLLGTLEAFDFMSFINFSYDFSKRRFLLVEGKNGAGKSVFTTEALLWVLYGKTLRGLTTDEVIREGAEEARVSLSFSRDQKLYEVTRRRTSKGKSYLEFSCDGDPQTAERVDDTQKLVEQALGRTFDQFRQLVVLDLRLKFPDLGDSAKKDFIESMVDSSVFQDAFDEADGRLEILYKDLEKAQLGHQALGMKKTTTQSLLEKARADQQGWEDRRQQRLASLEAELAQAEEYDAQASLQLRAWLEEEKKIQVELHQVGSVLAECSSSRNTALLIQKDLEVRLNSLFEELRQAQSWVQGQCPTCGQDVHEEKRPEVDPQDLQNSIQQTQEVLEEVKQRKSALDQEWKAQQQAEQILKMSYAHLQETMRRSGPSRGALVASLRQQISALKAETPPRLVGQLEAEIAQLATKLQGSHASLVQLSQTYRDYEDALLHLGPQGVRSYVLDRALGKINFHLATYLSEFDASVSVQISPEKSLKKKGAVVQKIDLVGTPRSYKAASRGEKKKVDLSFPLAFRRFLQEECGAVNLLVVDECDDGLDAQGMESLVEILAQEPCTVLFVSHHNQLKSLIPESVLVENTSEGSTLSFLSMLAA